MRGFTIIELLVVAGVAALLLALLLPMVSRSREAANRVQCASQLRVIGGAALNFAARNSGRFPMSYRLPSGSYPYRFPNVISSDNRLAQKDAQWQAYGTPWTHWGLSGAPEAVWSCPTAAANTPLRKVTAGLPAEWGSASIGIWWTNYMYLGGMHYDNRGRSTARWGTAKPAVRTRDPKPATLVLAADMVFYSGGPGFDWDQSRRYYINHSVNSDQSKVDFQNILYADGHVEGKGRAFYGDVVLNTTTNYSLQHAPSPAGGFFYWVPGQSAPAKADPVAPRPPSAPTTPTAPTTPPPPPTAPPPPPDTPDILPAG